MKNIIKSTVLLCLGIFLSSCELELQDTFNFKSGAVFSDPYENNTAWEFIRSLNGVNEDGTLDGEHFQYMEAAIRKADMIDVFNQTKDTLRTYLLLNNNAFTGEGDVIEIVTGLTGTDREEAELNLSPEEVMDLVDTPEKMESLRTLLKYHITLDYIQQVPTLAVSGTFYVYQTLVPGDDGLIAYRRDDDWDISINANGAPLPKTAIANDWNENVRNHNYVFSNGIGHILNDPVRNKPYPSVNN
ncbi:hypothetical protein [Pseudozobellia thermophila]|uniref:Fasciclin domain-containing protein n=1 Tax=Pseudozobellia thermophila TaxID=192903 RepID=A0A1M6HLX2_9FLAO|nr:hypothetical protein [Pseudozobellia thermophila]SHJ23172.1 hypothetical protein SAMN04488513_103100 [Pseudozobellia thermophila]